MKANQFIKEEDAVSPVIGVILMVAITVILAAVIGAFVFGMGSSVTRTYNIGTTAKRIDGDTIRITYTGGPDHDYMSSISIAASQGSLTGSGTLTGSVGNFTNVNVGSAVAGTRIDVIVTATFSDGTSQVILDTAV